MTDADPYLYPGGTVLRNKLDIRDQAGLDRVERQLVVQRLRLGVPGGAFDLAHLRDIHRHLFQDIYDWAGELRTVELSKGGHQFQFRRFIETGMGDIHRRLVAARFLADRSRAGFSAAAGKILGDLNYVHPFRDGNGRVQLQYLRQLAERAGHPVDLAKLSVQRWLEASRAAYAGDYDPMGAEIARIALG